MKSRSFVATTLALVASAALAGCAGGGEPIPTITGTPSSYESVESIRDAFVAAGGACPAWEAIDPGDYDAEAGRCDDSTVIAVYKDPAELADVVKRATELATETHLLVGENWVLNTPNPQDFVDALGGTVVTG
ncbi:hypothetical protein EG850_05795 [Gulosibacter macacae]|uniref:Lipoprotein n=1 Tax=Gulosibacter macacae TaxID=2488791 RepID=A0A3P3VX02_9MICO|nr:hypothetical protein [Gulosibacter macacae]RRJ87315.1 hypothetical protein EG850_05795 [Gulosibacter macacae]